MNANSWDVIKEINPAKKDAKWISTVCSRMRMDWRSLISRERMAINKSYLFSQQNMCKIMNSFKDKQFKKETDFIPLGIWNRILNILVEEIRKIPPKVQLKAMDAMAEIDKNNDVELFKLKEFHEQNINNINRKVGEVDEFIDESNFKSNILKEFKRLNLNPRDPEDIDFFQQNDFPRLKYEEAGQKLINIIMKLNRFDEERIMDFVIDALAANAICLQTYVDELTGQILYDRIYPEQAFGVWSDRRDGSNDISQGWQKDITVREWLGRAGNTFIWERDWMQLLWAINYANNTKYTGFIRGGITYSTQGVEFAGFGQTETPYNTQAWAASNLDWSLAYTYKIYIGYIEFSSIDATATYLKKIGTEELIPRPVSMDYFLEESEETKQYEKESYYNEQMYKTYYIATSSITQWVYNWGKVYYQQLHGVYDQFAKGTLMYYRIEGTSAVDISKFYIDFANLTAYRMKWIVYHAKPEKEQYIIEELIKVSKQMQRLYPQTTQSKAPTIDNILQQLINFKRENFVDIRSYPEIEGKTYPMLAPQKGDTGGRLDPLALALQAVEQWAEMQIAEKVGLNDLRLGQVQNAREGYKQNMQEMESSYNSTGWLFRMIEYMKEYTCQMTLNYSQDIVRFKDTIPYNWLKKLMGELEFENLKLLDDYAAHRYAIIIQDYNSVAERQMVRQAAQIALNARDGAAGISFPEYLMVIGEEDWKKAGRMLAYFQYKADKKQKQFELQKMQMQQQGLERVEAMKGRTEQMKGQLTLQGKQIDADATVQAAQIDARSKIDTKRLQVDSELPKQEQRKQSDMELMQEEANLKQQESLINNS